MKRLLIKTFVLFLSGLLAMGMIPFQALAAISDATGALSADQSIKPAVILNAVSLNINGITVPGRINAALSWSAAPGATGYRIKYGFSTKCYSTTIDVGNVVSYTIRGLETDTQVFFVVVAIDADGNEGPPSNEVSNTLRNLTSATTPTLNLVMPGNNCVHLVWTNVPSTLRYKVKYGTTPGVYDAAIEVQDISNNVSDTYYTVTGLTNDTKYYFAVSAVTSRGESVNSNEVSLAPSAIPSPVAIPTFESLGLYWAPYSELNATGEACEVWYRVYGGAGEWEKGMNLWYDPRTDNGRAQMYRGSIIGLTPGTTYEIECKLVTSGTVKTITASTWSESFPVSEIVYLQDGVSDETLQITSGGTPDGYKLYTHPENGSTTIDGGNEIATCINVSAPYVIIRGLELKGALQYVIKLNAGAHHVVIEDCDLSQWGTPRVFDPDRGITYGDNWQGAIYSREPSVANIVIQRNYFHHPNYSSSSWNYYDPYGRTTHPGGPQGIVMWESGGNHVIRYNTFDPGEGLYWNDSMGGASNSSTGGFPNCDSDIYGNYIANCYDDAIESEGGNRNVRIWGNYMVRTYTGVASAANAVGPLYIFRNIGAGVSNEGGTFFSKLGDDTRDSDGDKFIDGKGRRYLFNNTLLQPPPESYAANYAWGYKTAIYDAGGPMSETWTRNNIFTGNRASSIIGEANAEYNSAEKALLGNNSFDYDVYSSTIKTFADYVYHLDTGTEAHGIMDFPVYLHGNGPASMDGGNYQLDPSGSGYGSAEVINNFTGMYSSPDAGAQQNGSERMQFGKDAYRSDILVDAGRTEQIKWPKNTINLKGNVDSSLPGSMTVNWKKLSGSGGVVFENASSLKTKVTFKTPGTYVLRLTVSNTGAVPEENAAVFDDVTVIVEDTQVEEGLIARYDFNDAGLNGAVDRSRTGKALNLSFPIFPGPMDLPAVWNQSRHGLRVMGQVDLKSFKSASKLTSGITESGELTFNLWGNPAAASQTGPAHIAGLEKDDSDINFQVLQEGTDLIVRLKTTTSSDNSGTAYTFSNVFTGYEADYTVTIGDGKITLYKDGEELSAQQFTGSFSNWNPDCILRLFNDSTLSKGWFGDAYRVAFYNKALNHGQIKQNCVDLKSLEPEFAVEYYSDEELTESLGNNPVLTDGTTSYMKITPGKMLAAPPKISIDAEGTSNDVSGADTSEISPGVYKYARSISADGNAKGKVPERIMITATDVDGNTSIGSIPVNGFYKAAYTDTCGPTFQIQYMTYQDDGIRLRSNITDNSILVASSTKYAVKIIPSEPLGEAPTITIDAEGIANDVTNGVTDTQYASAGYYVYHDRCISFDPDAFGVVLEDIKITGVDLYGHRVVDSTPVDLWYKGIYTDTVIPVASVDSAMVKPGGNVTAARSTEAGTVYLVPEGVYTSKAELDAKVSAKLGTSARVAMGYANASIKAPLPPGEYKLYAVDTASNVSMASEGTVIVAGT